MRKSGQLRKLRSEAKEEIKISKRKRSERLSSKFSYSFEAARCLFFRSRSSLKERGFRMTEIELFKKMRFVGLDFAAARSLSEKGLILEKALKIAIPPRSVSDASCFRNVCGWIIEQIEAGRFGEFETIRRVIDFALESSMPRARNPAAVFMSILKKELHYVPKTATGGANQRKF